jgi:hypothetical protein
MASRTPTTANSSTDVEEKFKHAVACHLWCQILRYWAKIKASLGQMTEL